MTRRTALTAVALFAATAAAFLTVPHPPAAAAAGGLPPNAFKVQIRHPGWKRFAMPNTAAAATLSHKLRSEGWKTNVVQPRPGVFVVRAKMPQWHTQSVVTNRHLADQLVGERMAHGMQARVIPFHR